MGFEKTEQGLDYENMESKFRNSQNQRYAKQLFLDNITGMAVEKRAIRPLFTLHLDEPGYINFRKEYVADEDPTGYTTAMRLLENYDHWLSLMQSPWFKEAKDQWDVELEAKLASRAFKKIVALAEGEGGPALAAAKYIHSIEKTKSNKVKRGRPSREEVEGERKRIASLNTQMIEDLERIRKVRG